MQINERQLLRACQVLFGGQLDVSREFLKYIQWSGVKSAYRKKVRETHPDKAACQGELVQRRMTNEFRLVQEAYENLTKYLTARDNGWRVLSPKSGGAVKSAGKHRNTSAMSDDIGEQNKRRPAWGHRREEVNRPFGGFSSERTANRETEDIRSSRPATSSLYRGSLPKRRLLFGHFLYYSGLINWRTIVKALAWQRNNRPRLGELGKHAGWLTDMDVEQIIKNRRGMESFGQSAFSLRLLNPKQLDVLVMQQKRLQRRFGDFFIAHKIFSPEQMESFARECDRHNHQFPS